ncbi:MAG: CHAT domain-containing protein, partial [Ardenticatenales bacterium]|nr:CHAT domain-containing protein [Ardenticatenales bacterium]
VERLLDEQAQEEPLHYQRLAELLPEVSANTLFASILNHIRHATQQGKASRFFIRRQEYIGLSRWNAASMTPRSIDETTLKMPGDSTSVQEYFERMGSWIREREERGRGLPPTSDSSEMAGEARSSPIELRIGISGRIGHYYAIKVDSELGDGWGAVKVSVVQKLTERVEQVQALFSRSQLDRSEEKLAESFGRDLFETFLAPQDIGRLYTLAHFQASEQKRRLRLILSIADPALAMLSWELLYDTFSPSYLSLRRESSSIIREISRLSRRLPLRVEKAPLRILGLIASPAESESLQIEQEKAVIEEALARLLDEQRAELHWLETGSWDALATAMRNGPWHIFHFIGHGGFDEVRQEGFIMLVDEEGSSVPVRAEELGQLLSDNDLRLAVLNACESATGSGSTPLASTAATLMREGIPAVLAMQHLIKDEAAVEFSREFYEALASGYTIEEAVICARRALTRQAAVSIEWGIPTLYLRALDSQLLAPA